MSDVLWRRLCCLVAAAAAAAACTPVCRRPLAFFARRRLASACLES